MKILLYLIISTIFLCPLFSQSGGSGSDDLLKNAYIPSRSMRHGSVAGAARLVSSAAPAGGRGSWLPPTATGWTHKLFQSQNVANRFDRGRIIFKKFMRINFFQHTS